MANSDLLLALPAGELQVLRDALEWWGEALDNNPEGERDDSLYRESFRSLVHRVAGAPEPTPGVRSAADLLMDVFDLLEASADDLAASGWGETAADLRSALAKVDAVRDRILNSNPQEVAP